MGDSGGYYSYTTSDFGDFGDLGDIFSSFFGGGFGGRTSSRRNNGPRKGSDLNVRIEITFEQAFLGVEKEISVTRNETCDTCHGTGAKPGTSPVKCSVCSNEMLLISAIIVLKATSFLNEIICFIFLKLLSIQNICRKKKIIISVTMLSDGM